MAYWIYHSFDELYNAVSDSHRVIIDQLRVIFLSHEWVTQAVKWDCLHFRFPNGMRCYINFRPCKNTKKPQYAVLWVSRGAWMVRQEPWIWPLFDEVKTVVGKIIIKDETTLQEKAIAALVEKIYHLPKGIGVL